MSNANFINVHSLTGRRGVRKGLRVVEIYRGLGRAWVPVAGATFAHFEAFSEFTSSTETVELVKGSWVLPAGGWVLPEGGTIVSYDRGETTRRTLPAGSTVTKLSGGSAHCAATVAVVRGDYDYSQHL